MRVIFSSLMGFLSFLFFVFTAEWWKFSHDGVHEKSYNILDYMSTWFFAILTLIFYVTYLFDFNERKYRNKRSCTVFFFYSFILPCWIFNLLDIYGLFYDFYQKLIPYFPEIYKYSVYPYVMGLSIVVNMWLILQYFNSNQMTNEQYKKEILKR